VKEKHEVVIVVVVETVCWACFCYTSIRDCSCSPLFILCILYFQWQQQSLLASSAKERWYNVSRQVNCPRLIHVQITFVSNASWK